MKTTILLLLTTVFFSFTPALKQDAKHWTAWKKFKDTNLEYRVAYKDFNHYAEEYPHFWHLEIKNNYTTKKWFRFAITDENASIERIKKQRGAECVKPGAISKSIQRSNTKVSSELEIHISDLKDCDY